MSTDKNAPVLQGVMSLSDPAARARFLELPDRRVVMAISAMAAVTFIIVATLLLAAAIPGKPAASDPAVKTSTEAPKTAAPTPPAGTKADAPVRRALDTPPTAKAADKASGGFDLARLALLLFDYPSVHFYYPFSIQNLMHVLFFIGLGELFVRHRIGVREQAFMRQRYLPEDEETVLQFADLGPIRRRVAKVFNAEHGFLPGLIDISILQFQASRSVDQTVAVMNSSLELIAHRVDLRYGLVRFIAWMVPTMGFIGTVYGLGASLYGAGQAAEIDVQHTALTLGVGFDCTMVALMQSAVLVFIMHLVQEREELAVNLAGTYCLRNLINRMYVGRADRQPSAV